MKEIRKIETLFRDGLEDYSLQPPGSVWEKISEQLPPVQTNHPKSKFGRWIVGLFSVSIAVGLGIWASESDDKIVAESLKTSDYQEIIVRQNPNGNSKEFVTLLSEHNTEDVQNESKNSIRNIRQASEFVTVQIPDSNSLPDSDSPPPVTDENETLSKPDETETELPVADFICENTSGCSPFILDIENRSQNYDEIIWKLGNQILSREEKPIIKIEKSGTYTLTLIVRNQNKVQTKNIIIEVSENQNSNFAIENVRKIYTNTPLKFSKSTISQTDILWDFGDGHQAYDSNPVHTFAEPGTYTVSLTTSGNGACKDDISSQPVTVISDRYKILAPDAFQPNDYGENDGRWAQTTTKSEIFYPVFFSRLGEYKLRIYNRLGQLVFESDNQEIGWNGYFNHKLSKTDVYVWECSGRFEDGEYFHETGNITLIR